MGTIEVAKRYLCSVAARSMGQKPDQPSCSIFPFMLPATNRLNEAELRALKLNPDNAHNIRASYEKFRIGTCILDVITYTIGMGLLPSSINLLARPLTSALIHIAADLLEFKVYRRKLMNEEIGE